MKNKRNMVAIIVIVAVLLCLAITAFFLIGRKSAAPAALTPIEGDAGNLADDEWTARY